ncbi:MAG: hypothetical protein ACRC62_19065 [Microcoleus sp.]
MTHTTSRSQFEPGKTITPNFIRRRRKKEEGRRKKEEGRGKKEEGRRKREEGRRKKEEGRRKKEEGRGKRYQVTYSYIKLITAMM